MTSISVSGGTVVVSAKANIVEQKIVEKISGDEFRLSFMVGDAVSCGMEFPGNPVKIKFDKPVSQINREIMKNGIGHHWMVAYGDHSEALRRFCKIKGMNYYQI